MTKEELTQGKKLNKKQYKELEKCYNISVETYYRPPVWSVEEGLLPQDRFDDIMNTFICHEINLSPENLIGYVNDDDSVTLYHLIDNYLHHYLYSEIIEYTNDDKPIHTGEYELTVICISKEAEYEVQ